MASNYVITLPLGTNGSSLDVTVPTGTILTDYSLKLVGRGAPGYGLAFAENALKSLTNSASVANDRPIRPLVGQIWYNHSAKQLQHFVGVGVSGSDAYGWSAIPSASAGAAGATPITVSSGGTGANSAAGALTALGAVAKAGDTMTGFLNVNTQAGVPAAGQSQSNATQLTGTFCEVTGSQVDLHDGVKLPTAVAGRQVIVINASGNAIKIYPSAGQRIESQPVDTAVPLGVDARLMFVAISDSKWYMLSAIYE